ncbi:hypothetical protein YTPLAS21_21520 [Candidatus Nitrosocosmicus sp.]|nr:hypothetical protein YTPLAS21_21520 [Candidatus Nitrosocosmicus sp.]
MMLHRFKENANLTSPKGLNIISPAWNAGLRNAGETKPEGLE